MNLWRLVSRLFKDNFNPGLLLSLYLTIVWIFAIGVFALFFFVVVYPMDPPEPIITFDCVVNGCYIEDMLVDSEGNFVGIPILFDSKDAGFFIIWLPPFPKRSLIKGISIEFNWFKLRKYYNALIGCSLRVCYSIIK